MLVLLEFFICVLCVNGEKKIWLILVHYMDQPWKWQWWLLQPPLLQLPPQFCGYSVLVIEWLP